MKFSTIKGTGSKKMGSFLIITLSLVQTCLLPPAQPALAKFPAPANSEAFFSPAHLLVLNGKKIEALGELYLVKDLEDSSFLEVIERLPSGGFGRLLRYRGGMKENGWVDLEFIYEDQAQSVTLLDYVSGRFFKITLTEKKVAPSQLFPLKDEKGSAGELMAAPPDFFKVILSRHPLSGWILPVVEWPHFNFVRFSASDLWSRRHLRGPPEGGAAL